MTKVKKLTPRGRTIAPVLFLLAGCSADFDEPPTDVPPVSEEPCLYATSFSVSLCIDDNENLTWYGLWDECFNQGAETSWEPALGIIKIRSKWELCPDNFKWKSVEHLCQVPDYQVSVDHPYNYWELCITFPPDECLAETIPNCYNFLVSGIDCPY